MNTKEFFFVRQRNMFGPRIKIMWEEQLVDPPIDFLKIMWEEYLISCKLYGGGKKFNSSL